METTLQKVFNELLYRKKVSSQVDFGNKLEYKSEGYISNLLKSHGPPFIRYAFRGDRIYYPVHRAGYGYQRKDSPALCRNHKAVNG